MTEDQWLANTNIHEMVMLLKQRQLGTERQLRLFAVACCRRIWKWLVDERSRAAVEICELYVDRRVSRKAFRAARRAAFAASKMWPLSPGQFYVSAHAAVAPLTACLSTKRHDLWVLATGAAGTASSLMFHAMGGKPGPEVDEMRVQCDLLRDIFDNPFRPASPLNPFLLTPQVLALAEAAYAERLMPQGTLDPERLIAVADTLEEVGCADRGILEHLRCPGPHVLGCWGLDFVLGKE